MKIDTQTTIQTLIQTERSQRTESGWAHILPADPMRVRGEQIADGFDLKGARAPDPREGLKLKEPRFCAPAPSLGNATGAGWSAQVGDKSGGVVENQRACLEGVKQLHGHLADIKLQYQEWKAANPNAPEPTDGEKTIGEIVGGDMPTHEQCVRLLCIIVHEHPEIVEQAGVQAPDAGIPNEEIPGQQPQPAAGGGDFLGMLGETFGPLAQLLGGLLSSPLATPLLMAAANLIPPPVGQVVALAVPVIAPIAGQLLSGVGASASGQPAAAGGGADLSGLISGVSGLLGGAGSVAGAPVAQPA